MIVRHNDTKSHVVKTLPVCGMELSDTAAFNGKEWA
jgi:hypothetical protein